jgi:hypothetical protein
MLCMLFMGMIGPQQSKRLAVAIMIILPTLLLLHHFHSKLRATLPLFQQRCCKLDLLLSGLLQIGLNETETLIRGILLGAKLQ